MGKRRSKPPGVWWVSWRCQMGGMANDFNKILRFVHAKQSGSGYGSVNLTANRCRASVSNASQRPGYT